MLTRRTRGALSLDASHAPCDVTFWGAGIAILSTDEEKESQRGSGPAHCPQLLA